MTGRTFVALGGTCGALGVALSAMAAHADTTGQLATAAQMLLFHAPAFLGLAVLGNNRLRFWAGFVLAAGLALFASDLMVRSLFGWAKLFPMAAPSGGILMIVGWLLIAISAYASAHK